MTNLKKVTSFSVRQVRSLGLLCLAAGFAWGQVSSSAYRVLGQTDLRQNGINMVLGVELYSPSGVAVDARDGGVHLYISDSFNCRVLAWRDALSYQIGDPPNLVLGQPGPQYSKPLGIGPKGFKAPLGLAVDPQTGNLYVADFGNNRVLRFLAPFSNPTRVEPDAVYGQPDFVTVAPGVTRGLMNGPRSVAVDSGGNLWVSDSGNNRVLRFAAAVLNNPTPPDADTVIGQADFFSGAANQGGTISASGFNKPAGITFDPQGNLYVADFNNTRVLKFSAPLGPNDQNPAASAVAGEPDFATVGVPPQASNTTLAGPVGLSTDNAGNLYVTVPADNRVLVFSYNALPAGGKSVIGQSDFTSTTANPGIFPLASANTLYGPQDVKADSNGNVYVADTGNNRVLSFPENSKTASRVWGQSDFSSNGANQVKAGSLNLPYKVAIDYSQSPYAIYVSDTANNRVLGWKDSVHFHNGDPADLVIGQPDFRTAVANVDTHGSAIPSRTSLFSPEGIVVDQSSGALFVADAGNNRVLRFPRPVAQIGRITPDAVIGQVDFNSSVSAAVSAFSLKLPGSVALGPNGDLFVADTGNSRVLEYAAGAGTGASAIRVYGQPNFASGVISQQVSAQTMTEPQGLFVDSAANLYVADTNANRVLIFPNTPAAPPAGMAAAFVIGQPRFDSHGTSTFSVPSDVATDQAGNIYVSDSGNNRVLEFSSLVFLPIAGAAPTGVVGQQAIGGTAPNWNSPDGLATPEGLRYPAGIYLDRQDTLYVADTQNSRVVHFLKPAAVVNAATFQASVPVAPGGLVSLFGPDLAPTTAIANGAPWQTSMLNRQIVVNDQTPSPLYVITPGQINFQLPALAPLGSDRIAVRLADTGELIAGGTVLVAANSPGIFTLTQDGTGQAAVLNSDNRVNGSSNPAAVGSIITLFGTGQGQVSPAVPDGIAAPTSPLSNTVAVPTSDGKTCVTSQPSMCVAIGTAFGDVQYTGLAPGYIGLWQINVKIPQGTPSGNAVPLRVVINGVPSNTVSIAVKAQ